MINVRIDCLDYMNQLNSGQLVNYLAGLVMGPPGDTWVTMPEAGFYMLQDTNYLYITNDISGVTRKYQKSNLTLIATSPAYGGTVTHVAQDNTYIYMSGQVVNRVRAYLKTDLTYVRQSNVYAGGITGFVVSDGTYVYFDSSSTFYKVTVVDLTVVSLSIAHIYNFAANGWANYVIDSGYIYVPIYISGLDVIHIIKLSTTDLLEKNRTSKAYSDFIFTMTNLGDYLYISGRVRTVSKLDKAGMNEVAISPDFGYEWVKQVSVSGDYVYACQQIGTGYLRRYTKDNLTYSDSINIGLGQQGIAADGNYIYISSGVWLGKVPAFRTVSQIIDDILSKPMQLPAITKGTIDPVYGDLFRTAKISDKTLLQTLLTFPQFLGGYMDVDNSRQLNWSATVGEDKGQQIRYQKSLLGIERNIDYSQLYNRIYCYGRYSGGEIIKLSDITANDYVEDVPSQGAYGGIYVASFTDLSINTAAALLEWANTLLAEHKDPPISYRISAVNLAAQSGFEFEELQVGSVVTVIDEDLGINVSTQVIEINYPNLQNPHDMDIELSTSVTTILDDITRLETTQKSMEMII